MVLTEKETVIRQKLIKAASDGKTLYYSDLVDESDGSLVRALGQILEKITIYDKENKLPLLSSIVISKVTGLPNEGFFEMCDTLNIDAFLSDLQRECFEYWSSKDIQC